MVRLVKGGLCPRVSLVLNQPPDLSGSASYIHLSSSREATFCLRLACTAARSSCSHSHQCRALKQYSTRLTSRLARLQVPILVSIYQHSIDLDHLTGNFLLLSLTFVNVGLQSRDLNVVVPASIFHNDI